MAFLGDAAATANETLGGTTGDPTLEDLDAQIAELEGHISTSMEGGQAPDYSSFYKSPGYDFRFNEGVRARDRSAAAKGKLFGGGYGRELTRYGQGFASGEFGNYANRLATLAGIGQTATQQTGALGANTAAQFGNTTAQTGQSIMSGGQAQAEGIIGSNNAWQQGLAGVASPLVQWGMGGRF